MTIYCIGGSPCSGKSTIAEMLAAKYGFHYYIFDHDLEKHMKQAADENKPRSKAYFHMSPDEIWMRPPQNQFEDEVAIYKEIFEYACTTIQNLNPSVPIITEGAGFLPELVKKAGFVPDKYACIVPTREFQVTNYKKREWVPYILEGCSDKQTAFDHWMERDAIFASYASKTAQNLGYETYWIDGSVSPDEILKKVEKVFHLS